MLAGPYATMMLGDLGAEIIKIEPPGRGEKTRSLLQGDPVNSRHGMGAYFLALNRNKKSVAIDLKSSTGRALFYELARVSDAVVCNFSPGVTTRLEIDHPRLSQINPRIVSCSITGFGQSGPNRDQVSFDMVAQATGGGMSLTGTADGPPVRAGLPIGDLGAALMAVIGVLAALRARDDSGRGREVDISMQDGQLSMLSYMAVMHGLSGFDPGRIGNAHFVHVPYDTYRASDGWLIVAVVFDAAWRRLLEAVDCPDLDTEEHRTQPGRLANRTLIDRRLGERFATAPRAHWLAKLRAAKVPCAPVQDLAEAWRDPPYSGPQHGCPARAPGGRLLRRRDRSSGQSDQAI